MNEQRPCWLYKLFAADGELVYVGVSYDPKMRIASHRSGYQQKRSKAWMSRVVRTEMTLFSSRALAQDAEEVSILEEQPTENRLLPVRQDELTGNRTSGLKVRCSKEELDEWHRQAAAARMTISNYVRSLLHDAKETECA